MIEVLHVVPDDKFIDSIIEIVASLPNYRSQKFVFVSDGKDVSFKYIKNKNKIDCILNDEFNNYISSNNIKVVFIHSFYALSPKYISNIPQDVKVVWLGWGGDLYESMYFERPLIKLRSLYHPLTKIVKEIIWISNYRNILFKLISRNKKNFLKEAWRRIDFFSGVIPDEYEMIVNNPQNSFFRASKIEFRYFSLHSVINEINIDKEYVTGNDILLGNSGDEANNHLDAIYLLNKLELNGKKIFVPLSYNGTVKYLSLVKKYGHFLWGDNFVPLEKFVPIEEYNKIVSSSRYAIFYHERQQAVGNILNSLWNGCMVFISETSPLFKYLSSCGYVFFSVQKELTLIEKNAELSMEEKMHNRVTLLKYESPKVGISKINKIFEEMGIELEENNSCKDEQI